VNCGNVEEQKTRSRGYVLILRIINNSHTTAATEEVPVMNNHDSLQQDDNTANLNTKVDKAVYRTLYNADMCRRKVVISGLNED